MTTAAALLDVARAELGTAEDPPGTNQVRYNNWYYGREVSGSAYPWCAVFVSWVADRAGATDVIPKHAYTPTGASWFQRRGASAWGSEPRIGAIVYYANFGLGRISHVGIVETVHPDGSWTAIEGNTDASGSRTGGQVMRQTRRSVGAGGGFGYPAYGAEPGAKATGQLDVDGDLGPATIRRWQQVMGTPVDGVISTPRSSLVEAVQRRLHAAKGTGVVPTTGQLDAVTIRALQRYLGTPVDGVISRPRSTVVEALQRRLNTGRF